MSGAEHTILVASPDPELAGTRKRVLEAAEYEVIPLRDSSVVGQMCKENPGSLLVIGYSVARAEMRRIWQEAEELQRSHLGTAQSRRNM